MADLKRAMLLLMGAPLGSCVTAPRDADLAMPEGHNFSYTLADRESVDLVQAFDDGRTTYLQFTIRPADDVDVRRADGQAVTFSRDDHYLKVPGVYHRLRVTVANHEARIVNQVQESEDDTAPAVAWAKGRSPLLSTGLTAVPVPLPSEAVDPSEPSSGRLLLRTVGIPETMQTMGAHLRVSTLNRESGHLESQVEALAAVLEDAHREGAGGTMFLRRVGVSSRVVLTFADRSSDISVPDGLQGPLGAAARSANRIYLHGHTDAFVASDAGTALAIRRAVAVRQLLASLHVEPERMRLFYRGAGSFIANNRTPEGKALNRRVEVELRQW